MLNSAGPRTEPCRTPLPTHNLWMNTVQKVICLKPKHKFAYMECQIHKMGWKYKVFTFVLEKICKRFSKKKKMLMKQQKQVWKCVEGKFAK
uniref:Uncharacterized protein n=1 Tax=Crocodylus porosus TaxID=8502 RepID=A0A7M4E3X2_CROPO